MQRKVVIGMIETIEQRRSVRKYADEALSFETVREILEIAGKAPSWKNLQCWHFVAVDDPAVKDALYQAVPAGNPGRESLRQAPYVVVVLAEPEESGDLDGKPYYLVDGGIVFSTLMLAAADRGLGTCFIGWFDEDTVRSACDVPASYKVIGLTPLGVPLYLPKEKPRKPLDDLVSHNTFGKEPR